MRVPKGQFSVEGSRSSPRVTLVVQMAALYNEDPSKECLFARLSLDLNLLALQRSSTVVEVRH